MIERLALALAACAFLMTGCSKRPDDAAPDANLAQPATPNSEPTPAQPAPPVAENPVIAPLATSDIDRWQRGLQAELQAVQEASTQLDAAKDENEKLNALMAANEMSTIDAGAAAAGLDRDRYRYVRNTLSTVASQLVPIEQEMDVAKMPESMVMEMKKARESGLAQYSTKVPTDVMAALQVRAVELRELDKTVVAERLKVAGKAR